jgi:hypothetical protein
MNCTLCGKEIVGYCRVLNRLDIDERHCADICRECLEKFRRWQEETCARLFPTKAARKRFAKGK